MPPESSHSSRVAVKREPDGPLRGDASAKRARSRMMSEQMPLDTPIKSRVSMIQSTPSSGEIFTTGAVRRVLMRNFGVYSEIEYLLGSSLNVVIGPNGTGKSTLIAALCLGLGGSPDYLGARKLPEYVKIGCDEAYIEIELQGMQGTSSTYVISRTISASTSGAAARSTWTLNGKRATYENINNLINDLRIQVGNLCQFLPQERVADFAAVSPQERLRSTEAAVGTADMLQKHDRLIELSNQLKAQSQSTESDEANLEKMKADYEEKDHTIEEFNKQESAQEELQLMREAIPFSELDDLNKKRTELSERLKDVRARINAVQKENVHFQPRLKHASEQLEALGSEIEGLKAGRVTLQEQISECTNSLAKLSTSSKQTVETELPKITRQEQSFEDEMEKMRNDLIGFERRLASMEEMTFDEEEYRHLVTKIAELRRDAGATQSNIDDLSDEKSRLESGTGGIVRQRQQISHINNRIERMSSPRERRLGLIQQVAPEINAAVKFIRENKHLFEREVFEPPLLSVKAREPHLVKHLAAVFSREMVMTFTCMSRRDYKTFTKKIIDEAGISVNVVELSGTGRTGPSDYAPPIQRDSILRAGFDGYLIDAVVGPDPVLGMMCANRRLHTMPYVSRGEVTSNMEKFLERQMFVGDCIDSSNVINMSRSKYGRKESSVSKRANVNQPGWLKVFDNDDELSDRLVADRDRLESSLRALEEQLAPLEKRIEEATVRREEIKTEIKTLQEKKAERDNHKGKLDATRNMIVKKTADIQQMQASRPDFDLRRQTAESRCLEYARQIVAKCEELAHLQQQLVDNHVAMTRTQMAHRVYEAEGRVYEAALKDSVESLTKEQDDIKERGNGVVQEIRRLKKELRAVPEEQRQAIEIKIQEFESTEELKQKIRVKEAEIELSHSISNIEHIRTEHERLHREIDEMETRMQQRQLSQIQLEGQIEQLSGEWEPAIEKLVEHISNRFSEAFDSIGCSGEVVLGKDPKQYSNWRLDIRVSFRQNTEMQVLDTGRQSGGERSVSTVLFLMAMQELAKAPFRVVDEINQGMDPRNERMVHKRMVEVACQENTSQYILVTPKLLRDLPYHSRMKVCCIYSGQSTDSQLPTERLDTNHHISTLRALKAA